jgi:transcriptional regulator with XRE-family HTH domain
MLWRTDKPFLMIRAGDDCMNTLFKRLWHAFQDKEYRQVYADGFSDSKIATQIKVLREQRGWTQQQLAEVAGMKQSRIAALEDVNYSSWSLRTLRRLAQAFDIWLDVEFKEFRALWSEMRDFSRESLTRVSFADAQVFKEDEWALTSEPSVKALTILSTGGGPEMERDVERWAQIQSLRNQLPMPFDTEMTPDIGTVQERRDVSPIWPMPNVVAQRTVEWHFDQTLIATEVTVISEKLSFSIRQPAPPKRLEDTLNQASAS